MWPGTAEVAKWSCGEPPHVKPPICTFNEMNFFLNPGSRQRSRLPHSGPEPSLEFSETFHELSDSVLRVFQVVRVHAAHISGKFLKISVLAKVRILQQNLVPTRRISSPLFWNTPQCYDTLLLTRYKSCRGWPVHALVIFTLRSCQAGRDDESFPTAPLILQAAVFKRCNPV